MIHVGGINLVDSAINAEFRIGVLERIVERLLRVAPPGTLTQMDMNAIRSEVLEMMRKKYPDSGLQYNEPSHPHTETNRPL